MIWVVQIIVAIGFGMAGLMKATQPKQKLAENMAWVEDFSAQQIKAIGILEVLGAIGVILPVLTDILPWLTPLAAGGLVLTMAVAAWVHFRRNEYPNIAVNGVLLILAAIVMIHYIG